MASEVSRSPTILTACDAARLVVVQEGVNVEETDRVGMGKSSVLPRDTNSQT